MAILISGRGSNMDSILSAVKSGTIKNVSPKIVISSFENAPGLKVASEKYGITTKIIPGRGFSGWDYDSKIVQCLEENQVYPENGLVCLAGFMKILSSQFVRRYTMRILNIHPALLPSFPGLHAQKQAIDYGVKVSGCTVHFVDEGMDSGPIILQKAIEVADNETYESLAEKILQYEHLLYPQAINLISTNKVIVKGRKVQILQ